MGKRKNAKILVVFCILSFIFIYNLFWSESARLKKVVHDFDIVKSIKSDEISDKDIARIFKSNNGDSIENGYFIITLTKEELDELGPKQGTVEFFDKNNKLIQSVEVFEWKDKFAFKSHGFYYELR